MKRVLFFARWHPVCRGAGRETSWFCTSTLLRWRMLWNWSRSLAPLVQPVGFLWLIISLACVVAVFRKRWGMATLTFVLNSLIYIIGATSIPIDLLASLESPYATNRITSLPRSDAIVMLGGVLTPSRSDAFGFNLGPAADRILTAAELWRERRAPVLVLGGSEGSLERNASFGEGKLLEHWLGLQGIPTNAIICLSPSLNTHEEAEKVRVLAVERKWQRVLLVTSAFHMRRAEALFVQMKIPVTPAPCDFEGLSARDRGLQTWIPRYEGFHLMSLFAHEFIGWHVYRAQGLVGSEPPAPAKG